MRAAATLILALLTACSAPSPGRPSDQPSSPAARPGDPYPYTTPIPPAVATPLDGTYARHIGPAEAGGAGKCRRCPPYRMEESDQTLSFERGIFRISNEIFDPKSIDWKSVGHFMVDGDTVTLFNDPNCPTTRGTYRWRVPGGTLTLEVVDDPCAFGGLRWRYLTRLPWVRGT